MVRVRIGTMSNAGHTAGFRVTVNPSKYGLTNDEVDKRRAFVRGVRQRIAAYRSSVSSRGGYSQAAQRSQLLGSSKEAVAQQAAAAALREENDDFIGGEQLKRALIEREQDEVLDDLGHSVTRLGQMGEFSPLAAGPYLIVPSTANNLL